MAKVFTISVPPDLSRKKRVRIDDPRYVDGQKMLVEAMKYLAKADAGDRGWGYDGVDLYAVAEHYGGPDGLKRFVDACHVRGLAVVLDVVYNHFGPVGAYAGKFGPYLTNRH